MQLSVGDSSHVSWYSYWHCCMCIDEAMVTSSWWRCISTTVLFRRYWHCFCALLQKDQVWATPWGPSSSYERRGADKTGESVGRLDLVCTGLRRHFLLHQLGLIVGDVDFGFFQPNHGRHIFLGGTNSNFSPFQGVFVLSSMSILTPLVFTGYRNEVLDHLTWELLKGRCTNTVVYRSSRLIGGYCRIVRQEEIVGSCLVLLSNILSWSWCVSYSCAAWGGLFSLLNRVRLMMIVVVSLRFH